MHDHTQLLIKAAIIEDAAVRALQLAEDPTYTELGRVALRHVAAAHIWTVSVLTAEPQGYVRRRVEASKRDRKPLDEYRPRLVG
jgi:hypothetical protein